MQRILTCDPRNMIRCLRSIEEVSKSCIFEIPGGDAKEALHLHGCSDFKPSQAKFEEEVRCRESRKEFLCREGRKEEEEEEEEEEEGNPREQTDAEEAAAKSSNIAEMREGEEVDGLQSK